MQPALGGLGSQLQSRGAREERTAHLLATAALSRRRAQLQRLAAMQPALSGPAGSSPAATPGRARKGGAMMSKPRAIGRDGTRSAARRAASRPAQGRLHSSEAQRAAAAAAEGGRRQTSAAPERPAALPVPPNRREGSMRCACRPLRAADTKEAQPTELPAGPPRAGCTAARLNGLPCRPLRADGTSKHGPIAQRLEPPAHNRPVPGSNPGGPTNSLSVLGRWWLTRLWVSGADVVGPTVTNPGGPTNPLSMLGRWWLTRLWVTGADVVGVFLLRSSPFHLAPPASC